MHLRIFLVLLMMMVASPALAGDGADSPETIDKYAQAILGKLPCKVKTGEVAYKSGKCTISRTGQKDARGVATYALTMTGGAPWTLRGTLTPNMEGVYFAGESTCAGKDAAVPFSGKLERQGKKLWAGTLQPGAKGSALCGAFDLTIGK